MKSSIKKILIGSAYFVSLVLLGFSAYKLSQKKYYNVGIIAGFSVSILFGNILVQK